ncbi:hypothetical protein GQ55_4G334500 [Panicum hallii var. hallii]|uniref:Uncharacterized protein n=1 Tax=Panicum hallii var. hallii TaxID=1504633 RepID=A0A2T7E2U4_9POAL|nr:hypothetical protein GQ55_4G334500 [Panicum hallii var. hallii]
MPRRPDPKPAMRSRRDPKPATRSRRGPPRPRPRLPPGERDRRLAEEVLYLHSLWRRGPPAAAPTQSRSAGRVTTESKRRRLESAAAAAEPQDTGPEWEPAPSPPNSSPKTWPEAAPASSPSSAKPQPPPSPGALAQREALRAAAEFFSNRGSSDEDDDGGCGSESEGEQDAAGFITGLFERDAALRGHYERGCEEGQFACMACAGGTRKPGRRFRGCVALVQHARAATRYGRPRAHRALAAVVCRVLGWDVARLPSIVIDPRGTLGQALAAGATADVQPAKEEIEKENGYPSADGDEEDSELENSEYSAEKENVEKRTEDSRNTEEEEMDDDEEEEEEEEEEEVEEVDFELDNGDKSAEKEELEEKGSWNSKEISKNEVLRNESVQEVNASKDDSLNQGSNEEVHRQEIAKESSGQELDATESEKQHAKTADDTGDTAVTSLGNSSTVPPSSSVLYQKSHVSGLNAYMP